MQASLPLRCNDTAVYDTALQADGKVIGVGTVKQPDGKRKLQVFRLRPDGALDPDFGLGGLVVHQRRQRQREAGYSVIVDPDGRIVVAGQRGSSLLVARLLANGTLDAGFGSGGYLPGLATSSAYSVRIARAPAGGYRVIANLARGTGWDCTVVGLTEAGVPMLRSAAPGYVTPQSPSGRVTLLLVTGRAARRPHPAWRAWMTTPDGYVGRLLPNGAIDAGFDAGAVPGRFKSVHRAGRWRSGSIFVTGNDRAGLLRRTGRPVARRRHAGHAVRPCRRDQRRPEDQAR